MDKPVPQPPLWLWIWLLVATAGLLGWIYRENKHAESIAAVALDDCLISRARAGADKPVVLIIGTSLTQAGLDSSSRIARCIKENTGTDITVLKCWQSGADLKQITDDHAALFRRLRPAIVLIEANTLFYRPRRQAALSRYMQTFRDLVRRIKKNTSYDPDDRGVVVLGGRTELGLFRAGLVDSTGLATFRNICTGWQRQHVFIGLVNFPLEKMAENDKWQSPDTAAFNRNLRFLRATGPVACDDPKMQLDSSFFYDFGHLNRKGNDVFAPWFCGLLSARVRQYAEICKQAAR